MIRSCFIHNSGEYFLFFHISPIASFIKILSAKALTLSTLPWGLHLWKFESAYQTHVLNITLRRHAYLWLVWKLLHLNHLYQYFLNSNQSFWHFSQWFVCLVVFNATFNNIAVITWQSVLLKPEDPEKITNLLESGLIQLFIK